MGNNGKRKRIHKEGLVRSSRDFGVFIEVVELKFNEVVALYMNQYGIIITVPEHIRKAMVLWRTVIIRHRKGDFRHTKSELKSSNEVGQWVLDEFLRLRNQPPATFTFVEDK